MNSKTETPRIYVVCLASYNNGILHGSWIDAAQDVKSIDSAIKDMLFQSPEPGAEEWEIHDYEGFYGLRFSRGEDLETVSKIASLLVEYGELVAKVIERCDFDLKWAHECLEDDYIGCYPSLEDYARESTLELENIPEYLIRYIDFERFGSDMERLGDIFTIEMGGGETHVFLNH